MVLRGDVNEASSALIKGTVVLCLSESLRVNAINLRLTGDLRVGYTHRLTAAKTRTLYKSVRNWGLIRRSDACFPDK